MTPVIVGELLVLMIIVLGMIISQVATSWQAASLAIVFLLILFYYLRLKKRGRTTLLRTLRALNPEDRDKLLHTFTPKVRSELLKELRKSENTAEQGAAANP
jgi:uncharacterized protein (DUF58 family)